MAIRSPIVSVLGHVDHGKSSILDAVRGTSIVSGEAGAITQAIGASVIPISTIRNRCGKLIETLKMNITIPGLLLIDTPGHAAFTSLRKRGGSIADIAIVVIDINEGFKPQTIEAIEVLKNSKTPFIIAANKVDLISGFIKKTGNFIQDFQEQPDNVKTVIETKMYELVGSLHEKFGLDSERYDRVGDYTKQVGIIPCSAKEDIGLEELLMVLTGLAQRYLEKSLNLDVTGPARGIILEVKEDKGLGKTVDCIIYDGNLKQGEPLVIGTVNKPLVAKVRALFLPEDLKDMRDKKSKFRSVKSVTAATGVKISSPDFTEDVVAGMPVSGVGARQIKDVEDEIASQISEVTFDTDKEGIVIKADTLGSLEALIQILREKNIPIRKAGIGNISRKDIADAESSYEKNPIHSVILGFNIKEEKSEERVKIIVRDVIYALLDDYEVWSKEITDANEAKSLDKVTRPCKVEVLQNCIFRQSNPCIAGVEVLLGKLGTGSYLMDAKGKRVAEVKSLELDKKNVSSAEKGLQVAASLPGATGGRQIHETEVYYTDLSEESFRKLKTLAKHLSADEKEALREIASIKRENNPLWGV